jgi:hypothetical protein
MSKVSLAGNASGTGIFTIASPNSNTDRTLTLPDSTGTLLTSAAQSIPKSALPTGSVLQVVQGVDTTFRSTTTNWPVASGFGASITPTSASSKILVMMNIQFYLTAGSNTNKIGVLGIYRSSTYLMGQRVSVNANYSSLDAFYNGILIYLDSPATTSSTTYNFYWGRYDSVNFQNQLNMGDGLPTVGGIQPSTITLMEIAA